jgi:carboxyl-terminal processing protease
VRRFAFVSFIALMLLTAALGGCARSTASIPLTGLSLPVPKLNLPFLKIPFISVNNESDYSRMDWVEAFDTLHGILRASYPYTEWKAIDWDALEAEYAPRIETAEAAEDEAAYYALLRQYASAIRDANVHVSEDLHIMAEAIGGGFGVNVVSLDDGRVIAYILLDGGPAAVGGMEWGAQILTWNGIPVADALQAVPLEWSDPMPATEESRARQRERLLVRAPEGQEVAVTFQNPNGEAQTVALTAIEDAFVGLQRTYPYQHVISEFDSPLDVRVLKSGLGYIRIYALSSTITTPFPGRAVRKAVDDFIAAEVPGIIVDVRGNTGGIEDLIPEFLQPFFKDEAVYKRVALYDDRKEEFVTSPELQLMIRGGAPFYEGPIAVLVDESTMGTGEGIPMVLDRLPNVQVVGMSGTHGAFGIIGGEVVLPGGHVFSYPIGRSLDEAGAIVVEADAAGAGGVQPDVRVPRSEENLRRMFLDEADVILEAAEATLQAAINAS